MNCLINLLALCVFDPANVYVTGEMFQSVTSQAFEGRWCKNHFCNGPLAEVRIGIRAPLTTQWDIDYGIRHTSFVMDDDRGEESAFVSLTWKPFR